MTERLIIIGSGGHAAVVADALLASGEDVIGLTDLDSRRHGKKVCGLPVLGGDEVLHGHSSDRIRLVNGIGGAGNPGSMTMRQSLQRRLESDGWTFAGVRHPSAVVSAFADVHRTSQLFAHSVVQAGAVIGDACIVNTAAIVEHDAVLGRFVHVSCGAVVCGGVGIGDRSHIGAGAVVRQGVRLGVETIVGAGAVVLLDCQGEATLIGVPAREKRG